MGHYEQATWVPSAGAYGGRKARTSFVYDAYIPDLISDWDIDLPAEITGVVAEAEAEVVRLEAVTGDLHAFEILARQLLRAEAVGSSRIEGLQMSHRKLALAASVPGSKAAHDVTAQSILGNIAAMETAIAIGARADCVSVANIVQVHEVLLKATRDAHIAGRVRSVQNWIGGRADSPRGADFIPPPADRVDELLVDLAAFMNRDDLPVTVQAAIVHAQFETIHPFADGNGRVGRALVHTTFRRRALIDRFVPPVSLVLASNSRAYISGLTDYRNGRHDSWIGVFGAALRTAAREGQLLASDVSGLRASWIERIAGLRRDSTARALVDVLHAHPVLDVATAARVAGVSKPAANNAIAQLERAGILTEVRGTRRNRSWEARDVFSMLDEFERRLALPAHGGKRRASPT